MVFDTFDSGQRYFSDAQFGSTKNALKAAIGYRDLLVKENAIPLRAYDGNGYHIQDKRNTSGTVGICLAKDKAENPGRVSWQCRIMVNGKQKGISFSIRKFGYAGAWKRAYLLRSQHLGSNAKAIPPEPPDWLVIWMHNHGIG